jgi:hypothetical protein
VKDLLTNVGSGGGAAAAPAAGGAAPAAGEAAAEEKPAEKEEGMRILCPIWSVIGHINVLTMTFRHFRERGVRRGHGIRSVRLSGHNACLTILFLFRFSSILLSLLPRYPPLVLCTR